LLLLFQADPLRIRAINAPTMRSKLFVPGSRPELFAKALASSADAISIDLEDSVVENRKAEARATVRDFLLSPQARSTTKAIIVRVNALDTPHFEADVQAIVQPGLALLNVPKAESAANIHAAVAMLERVEAANGITTPLRVLANIETPKGLRFAAEIAGAHSRVAGLQLGYVDLFGSMNIDRRDSASIHATLFAVRTAAGSAGVFAYDGAFGDVNDVDGFKAEAQMARALGYWGKSCIHPSQVALANEVFRPRPEEIAFAQRVIEASREAEARGVGAFVLDGKMIEVPVVRRAEAILAISRQAHL
jgi:citrate lyase subunit beta/citryl-CoA lyase